MTDAKWADILDKIEENFGIKDQGKEDLPDVPNATREFVVFDSPLGLLKFERTVTPRVEGTKVSGGSKYGSATDVEKIYSEDETVNTFQAYRFEDDEWVSINAEGLI